MSKKFHIAATVATSLLVAHGNAIADHSRTFDMSYPRSVLKEEFISRSDLYSIAQINPLAAALALRFTPERYQRTEFHEGDAIGKSYYTLETVTGLIAGEKDREKLLRTVKPAPEGQSAVVKWQLLQRPSPRSSVWRVETYFRDANKVRGDDIYPEIDIHLSESAPFHVLRWEAR